MSSFLRIRFRPKSFETGREFRNRAGGEEKKKREFIWWPDNNAMDRQKIEIGVPFKRKGEWIIVWQDEKTGAIKSKACAPPRKK